MKITVWYITAGEYEILKESIKVMVSHDWVDRIVIAHTDPKPPKYLGELSQLYPGKIDEKYQFFGAGWNTAIEKGGFDEVFCRNWLIRECSFPFQKDLWLLQCDSDEFYTYETGQQIKQAQIEGYTGLTLNCNNFKTLTKLMDWGIDNHLRAWRADSSTFYARSGHVEGNPQYDNKSIHCSIPASHLRIKTVKGYFHIHTHDMWPQKNRPVGQQLIEVTDFQWPENYVQLFGG